MGKGGEFELLFSKNCASVSRLLSLIVVRAQNATTPNSLFVAKHARIKKKTHHILCGDIMPLWCRSAPRPIPHAGWARAGLHANHVDDLMKSRT